ncbi:NLI interacting factor-like phosphatase family protein, putative [Ichthyophthirius multifiliis]|uniref:NLI interacting factor-like phosphatase family protein, putative n=1 Tax=Ichthyophthirius multifiliis TaxID=5932 RepID=G0QW02_ICHMU|nr:NLI interacting factor-like phosphatase family protein, putative [Ichthyophthirius multifiliis]EGR30595.1 NLI interacting factor-like phosphatase family protein, putative [Ichthyophthirius multifiliis]|eukprot:XP_004032182.1 NLI interacting factor-like phosphatase family protein, putative [Ichthyophthirius multifiliis]
MDLKTLVIDLDETLVHCYFKEVEDYDFTLTINIQNIKFDIYVKKRPGCELFLEILSQYYEIIIFTASLGEYANPVIDQIDKNKVVASRIFRENCTFHNGIFVKDLSKLKRDLKDIIIIDNSECSFLFQKENAILIDSFFDDIEDQELFQLIPFLMYLNQVYDVRNVQQKLIEFVQNQQLEYISSILNKKCIFNKPKYFQEIQLIFEQKYKDDKYYRYLLKWISAQIEKNSDINISTLLDQISMENQIDIQTPNKYKIENKIRDDERSILDQQKIKIFDKIRFQFSSKNLNSPISKQSYIQILKRKKKEEVLIKKKKSF